MVPLRQYLTKQVSATKLPKSKVYSVWFNSVIYVLNYTKVTVAKVCNWLLLSSLAYRTRRILSNLHRLCKTIHCRLSSYLVSVTINLLLAIFLLNRAKSKITFQRSLNNSSSFRPCILTTSTNCKNLWKKHISTLHRWWILIGNSSFLSITSSPKRKARDSKLCSIWHSRLFPALCRQIVHLRCYLFVSSTLPSYSTLRNRRIG